MKGKHWFKIREGMISEVKDEMIIDQLKVPNATANFFVLIK